uniref:Uncharacterized protein n=1 Tax=Meloidogyne enterolobii TaxID=390850 RepID=A0A6V7WSZ9_MELEN|nr:unnamed protein product [Meloidogyne enterolobii]
MFVGCFGLYTIRRLRNLIINNFFYFGPHFMYYICSYTPALVVAIVVLLFQLAFFFYFLSPILQSKFRIIFPFSPCQLFYLHHILPPLFLNAMRVCIIYYDQQPIFKPLSSNSKYIRIIPLTSKLTDCYIDNKFSDNFLY